MLRRRAVFYVIVAKSEMINTNETGIGIGIFPIIGVGFGIGFKQTYLLELVLVLENFDVQLSNLVLVKFNVSLLY